MEGAFDPADGPGGGCVVFDLEFTAWEGSMASRWSRAGEYREVIQFGAVRLGPAPALAELAAFRCLVRPVLNPVLSDYIEALTGITQAMVDRDGLAFPEALARFDDFVGDAPAVYSNGADHLILDENAGWHGIASSRHRARMVSIRHWLGHRLGLGDVDFGSGQVAALASGTAPETEVHDALADARTIALGLRRLLEVERARALVVRC